MSRCSFTITFAGPAENIISKTKTAIEGQRGMFQGDSGSGTFNVEVMGTISGSYTIVGQSMNIDIDTKPLLVSCSMIESFMKSQFGG